MSHGSNGAQTFLNSPHARLLGTLNVNTQASPDQSVAVNGTYNSSFVSQYPGGCASCHDVHSTTVKVNAVNQTYGYGTPTNSSAFHMSSSNSPNECVGCHSSHSGAMSHPTGSGTPFPNGFNAASGDSSSRVTCHMAAANGTASYHFFRINADVNYNTFPNAATFHNTWGPGGYGTENTYSETYTDSTTQLPKTYRQLVLT